MCEESDVREVSGCVDEMRVKIAPAAVADDVDNAKVIQLVSLRFTTNKPI